jgi:SAM-dependent methyltransferase
MDLEGLNRNRFNPAERAWKVQVWNILWRRVFSRGVRPEDTVLDLGAGYCEFINAAVARRRIAVDLDPDARQHAAEGVEVHSVPAQQLGFLRDGEVDVVFSSNFFEHLPTKGTLTAVVQELHRVLKPGGRLVAMGPNARLIPGAYWDYYDHQLPLTEKSVAELLRMTGFEPTRVEPRFLPYTVKGGGPRSPLLVEAYLALRPLSSWLLGKQFLVEAVKG